MIQYAYIETQNAAYLLRKVNLTVITNVVFDFGQVLVRFEPEYMCGRYVCDENDLKLLSDVIFDRLYWDRLDAGTISDEELISCVKERIPQRLHAVAEKIYFNWIYNLPEIDGMRRAIDICRERGFGVYLLSNISEYFAARYKEIPILEGFDGYVFSALAGCTKPSADIFKHLCDKFDLTPEQTLFVDDSIKNINGADKFGIIAYHFTGDAEELCSYLSSLPKVK